MNFQRLTPGNDVQVSVVFMDKTTGLSVPVTGVTFTVKEPNGTSYERTATQVEGENGWFCVLPQAESPGIWLIKAVCTNPSRAAVEGQFEVLRSLLT